MRLWFVWSVRRRRPVLTHEVRERLRGVFEQVAREHGWQLCEVQVRADHVRLCLDVDPGFAPTSVAYRLKSRSARFLLDAYPETFRKMPSVWTRRLLVQTSPPSEEEVEAFLASEKRR